MDRGGGVIYTVSSTKDRAMLSPLFHKRKLGGTSLFDPSFGKVSLDDEPPPFSNSWICPLNYHDVILSTGLQELQQVGRLHQHQGFHIHSACSTSLPTQTGLS